METANLLRCSCAAAAMTLTAAGALPVLAQEEGGRRIEEVIVTAERRQSTVQDTSISISAFDSEFLDNFNIRNQEDLQNYIPATTIQPYDAAIRGVGRTSRTLGGEPGVSTYFNGTYSEDFGIASTEGGLKDIARVEVLRGPQGVLYGRSAVGGAINFETKRPTDQYEFELDTLFGNFNTNEVNYVLSGPIIKDKLRARVTGSDRTRGQGFIEDTSPFGSDINDYGDENYTLSLEATPTDRLTLFARGNERSFRRKFNGGAGTAPITVGESGGAEFDEGFRNTTDFAFGFREIDRGVTQFSSRNFFDSTAPVFEFSNPATGAVVEAQRIRPGIDGNADLEAPGTLGDNTSFALLPNFAFGLPADRTHATNRSDMDEDDLLIDTNGQYDERFDHQATQFNATYDLDRFSFKYIFGYTDFSYERNTDEDKTGSTLGSSDFYVLQENENWQHELQIQFEGEQLSFTGGLFFYNSHIDQRLDLYDPIDSQGRIQQAASLDGFGLGSDEANNQAFGATLQVLESIGALGAGTAVVNAPVLDIRTAERMAKAGAFDGLAGGQFSGPGDAGGFTVLAPWFGGDTVANPTGLRCSGCGLSTSDTPGTHFAWANTTDTEAFATYGQAEWRFSDRWSTVLGLRYSRDEKDGIERLIGMQENTGLTGLALFDLTGAPLPGTAEFFGSNPEAAGTCGANLLCLFNAVNGAIDPTNPIQNPGDQGTNPGDEPVRFNGVPITFNIFRELDTTDEAFTWTAKLNFEPQPDTLIYLSAARGWKSGGFNLGFFSTTTPIFDEEEITAFELGYKARFLDSTLQLNTAIYGYLYDDIQTSITQTGGLGTGTNIVNAPEARTIGWEGDVQWLATDRITLGGNWSYTNAEFSQDFSVVDITDPRTPSTVFTTDERTMMAGDGNMLPKIPEWKFTTWANYTWPLGRFGTLDFFTTGSWTDEWFVESPFERDFDRAPSFWRWDARASWTSVNRRWEVGAFVNNITDSIGVRQIETSQIEENFRRDITPTDPRVYGAQLKFRFVGG